jgi:hypothetical protein
MDLLAEVAKRKLILSGEKGRIRYIAPAGTMTDDLRAALSQNRPEILRLLAGSPPPFPCCGCGGWTWTWHRNVQRWCCDSCCLPASGADDWPIHLCRICAQCAWTWDEGVQEWACSRCNPEYDGIQMSRGKHENGIRNGKAKSGSNMQARC